MESVKNSVDMLSLISKRDVERKLDLEKRKEKKTNSSAENEKLGYFEETFINKQQLIEQKLQNSTDLDKALLPNHFNEISNEILSVQKYVAASNLFLRTYDIKKCQDILRDLAAKAKSLEDDLLPKKKFGFKKTTVSKPQEPINTVDEVDFAKITMEVKNLCGYSNKIGELLIMDRSDIFKKDVILENLENCTVKLNGSPSTLHLNCLKNCYVFCGPVSTSIFAENCTDSTLIIACQQLRLHASHDLNIYLHVTSRAIMEDCNKVFLAPYNWKYDGLLKDFEESGLDSTINNWRNVDDFNWLNVKHSPNWSELATENIINQWEM